MVLLQFLPQVLIMVLNRHVAPRTPIKISPAFNFLFYKGNKLGWEGPKNKIAEVYEQGDADTTVQLPFPRKSIPKADGPPT